MKKSNVKFLCLFLLIITIVIIFLFLLRNRDGETNIKNNISSYIYLYNLGNSNVEIIMKDNYVVLVNTGLVDERDNLLDYLDQLGILEIDYLILTNKDDKYIGNASYIIENYKVDYVYMNDFDYSSENIDDLNNVLIDSYSESIVLTSNEVITLGDLIIDIYPYLEESSLIEDKSLIINIKEGKSSVFLTSNASDKRLKEINNSSLLVSENFNLYDVKSNYYIYDGIDKIKNSSNLLKRNKKVYVGKDKLIFE